MDCAGERGQKESGEGGKGGNEVTEKETSE